MMKIRTLSLYVLAILCTLGSQSLYAQIIDKTTITAEEANFELIAPNAYIMEIGGPNGYYYKQEIKHANNISIANVDANGKKFEDGSYLLQVTPILTLTDQEREDLNILRKENDLEKIAAYRLAHNLPEIVDVTNVYFSIRNGQFVTPEQKEIRGLKKPKMSIVAPDHPSLYASLNYTATAYERPIVGTNSPSHTTDNSLMSEDDQVFLDDVIIDGSICVGQDCVNGESFGFDTGRYKENNLRIHFDDTSNSASFPNNDWRITINDSANGGASYFAIEDATAGRVPFRIVAGAPANSLYVDAQGDIGIGTANPVVEAHIADGDTPTLRLEQNGSSGFTPQTWDIAGNEANFFIRDATNGSKLPFKIKPGAPSNSLYIDAEGDIGLGTDNPGSNGLQVESGNVYVKAGNLGVNVEPTVALDVKGNFKLNGATVVTGDMTTFLTTGATFFNSSYIPFFKIDATNNRIGIGTAAPGHLLELNADDAVKPNGGSWSAPSDRRLKTNIRDFNEGLTQILKVRPVKYNYNGKLGYPTEPEFIGVIAQEMKEVAPYTIKDLNHNREGENYLAFDPSALTYLLVNAVQEQQEIIETQQKEIAKLKNSQSKLDSLQAQVDALSQMVSSLKETGNSSADEIVGEKK